MNNADMPTMPISAEFGWTSGLTKREHFAGLAMHGLLSNSHIATQIPKDVSYMKYITKDAIRHADLLLKELDK